MGGCVENAHSPLLRSVVLCEEARLPSWTPTGPSLGARAHTSSPPTLSCLLLCCSESTGSGGLVKGSRGLPLRGQGPKAEAAFGSQTGELRSGKTEGQTQSESRTDFSSHAQLIHLLPV